MRKPKSYYIKERNNPQFKKPYFVACGQLSKRAAKRMETTLYGYNVVLEYKTVRGYNRAIDRLKSKGYEVIGSKA